jgi:nucleotide-binding universal stress UspA family protein
MEGGMERRSVMYKRILVATGGSPWSDAAVAYAIRLAAGTDAEVCILSVLTIPVSYDTPEAGMEFDMLGSALSRDTLLPQLLAAMA